MSWLSTIKQRILGSFENPNVSIAEAAHHLLDDSGGSTKAGVRINHKSAIGYPPLWRAVNLISGDVAKVPLELYHRTGTNGRETATRHASYRVMRRKANPWVTSYVFKRLLTYHALWHGNGYALIVRNGAGQVDSLIPIDPSIMVIGQENGEVWYMPEGVRNAAGKPVRYPARDILHIKGLSNDGLVGYDVISVMREALALGVAAREFGARFFGQGANASGILLIPQHFSETAAKNAIKHWNETTQGMSKSFKVGLLTDGVKFEPLTATMEASQFLETRQFEVREVANIIGVPPHKLGDPTRTAYSSLEQENQSYLQDCLDQWLCTWEDECYEKLLSEQEKRTDSHYFEFQRKALIRMDAQTETAVLMEQLNNGVLTLNEVRAIQNREEVAGGELRRIPLNLGLIDEEGHLIKIGEPEPEEEPVDDEEETTEEETMEDDSDEPGEMEAALEDLVRDRVVRMVDIERNKVTQAAGRDGNFLDFLGTFYEQQAERMTDAIALPLKAVQSFYGLEQLEPATYAATHCQTAEAALVELSGECRTTDQLQSIVTGYFEEDRVNGTVSHILKGVRDDETESEN